MEGPERWDGRFGEIGRPADATASLSTIEILAGPARVVKTLFFLCSKSRLACKRKFVVIPGPSVGVALAKEVAQAIHPLVWARPVILAIRPASGSS